MNPKWEDGAPMCTFGKCPKYDGKRCRSIGGQPMDICEPAVVALKVDRDDLKYQVEELRSESNKAIEKEARDLWATVFVASIRRDGLVDRAMINADLAKSYFESSFMHGSDGAAEPGDEDG